MSQKWLILYVIILMYLPVSIDATVLHVAAPRLGVALSATGDQLLWIIDIYSLVMAGLLLPMGALGDRIGFKRLALLGSSLFALASLAAALASSVAALVAARAFLAVGAAMILPATLSALRHTFTLERERNFALGIWSAVGTAGAAMGPLVGGWLMEYFYWGSVFLINLPIVAIVLVATMFVMPKQPLRPEKTWQIKQALVLISAILLLVYAAKSGIRGTSAAYVTLMIAIMGSSLLIFFVRHQLRAAAPMIDVRLITQRVIAVGIVMALTAMIALVGFELLLTQELQFVLGKTPLEAGLFLLPLMIASGVCGPIAGRLVTAFGLRVVATLGIFLSAVSFFILAVTDFTHQIYLAWTGMVLLGFSVEASMLASTAAIMTSVPKEKAGAAGALEGMAYELGAGLGVAVFGLLLSGTYAATIMLPGELPVELAAQARASISETVQVAQNMDNNIGEQLMKAAKVAFSSSHSLVLGSAGAMLLLLSGIIWRIMPRKVSAVETA
ncbi:SmvA family efflux MFS transporter [Serratia sp. JSRIV001]|uniref:SmvA family efflux MFS transporter n=1 Tax=unclassified Serratia (in: enterobacteria) TaxID=2647522 RepID=UPI001CBDA708|nr:MULTISPECIES: SmvA family efflux MFS transporter [unclassified Serratia (in: enterobacteria)]UAN45231.1 SmvA family efflux MFS transporter [Serratia sp. JSRIV001]UAN50705.1 SmvA family efflux MFS transporter [Serratia sp. JSRIV002]UAN56670.1 SmvA family efflux MFS transporter [Serratia sp. JSRIV004]